MPPRAESHAFRYASIDRDEELCLRRLRGIIGGLRRLRRPGLVAHEAYGVHREGETLFVNASTCTLAYRPDNPPVVI